MPTLPLLLILLAACSRGGGDGSGPGPQPVADADGLGCDLAAATVETDGARRVALLVGVGQYAHDAVPDLKGPTHDVARVYELLTGAGGYGFPKENVCVLTDAEATGKGVRDALDRGVKQRLKGDKDVFVVYYSGHGTQAPDGNGDEADQRDEALVLHDAVQSPDGLLVDDEFNSLLAAMQATGAHGTVILDSCHSGSATRDVSGTPRFVDLAEKLTLTATTPPSDDHGAGFVPEALGELVVLTAAIDGTSALERAGEGLFTRALVTALAETGTEPATWGQVAARLPSLVSAQNSPQIPWVHGNLGQVVFDNRARTRPLAWTITAVKPGIALQGPPLPGWGPGTVARVFDGASTPADLADPSKAKALLELEAADGVKGTARRTDQGTAAIKPGDLAVLLRPGVDTRRADVSLRASGAGALPPETVTALKNALAVRPAVNLVADRGASAFEVYAATDGRLLVEGPEGGVRNRVPPGADAVERLAENLDLHSRQRALRLLRGEGGTVLANDRSLQVRVVTPGGPSPDAAFPMAQAAPNQEQVIPLCQDWAIEVTLDASAGVPELAVGGAVLFNDGSILGFPSDGRVQTVPRGGKTVFEEPGWLKACPPTGIVEHVLVVGTLPAQPVSWRDLTARSKSTTGPGGLQAVLADYLGGTKGGGKPAEPATAWTATLLPLRVEVNRDARAPAVSDNQAGPATREYTIKGFDLRPYRPRDPAHPLNRVFDQVEKLSAWRGTDGARYAQHAWSKTSDRANLDVGIDCSRSIWYVFTRAGLPYVDAKGDGGSKDGGKTYGGYVSTWKMTRASTEMKAHFDDCSTEAVPRLGDVLVYHGTNSKGNPVGHTVMVIDPARYIAWGSHGWDGSTTAGTAVQPLLLEPPLVTPTRRGGTQLDDTGVEFQMTLEGHDWGFWDSNKIKRTGCWRHRDLDPAGLPNDESLLDACGGACLTAQ